MHSKRWRLLLEAGQAALCFGGAYQAEIDLNEATLWFGMLTNTVRCANFYQRRRSREWWKDTGALPGGASEFSFIDVHSFIQQLLFGCLLYGQVQ